MEATTINLQQFCHPNAGSTRFRMDVPFVRAGYRYATDGRIVVRVPAPGEPDTESDAAAKFPNADDIFGKAITPCRAPWPVDDYVRKSGTCFRCDGYGEVDGDECGKCYGSGIKVCPTCEHEEDCDYCDGRGKVNGSPCPACDSGNSTQYRSHIVVDGRPIQFKYAEMIRNLPGVQFCASAGGPTSLLGFVFDGGEGAVMPMNMEVL
jgi:hypothetical protein